MVRRLQLLLEPGPSSPAINGQHLTITRCHVPVFGLEVATLESIELVTSGG